MPVINYLGPGRDTFTYAQVKQHQGNVYATVYGSGIAGTHLPASSTLAQFQLVPPTQVEPAGYPPQSLGLQPWPGDSVNPICGMPPALGPADLIVEVYENRYPVDGGGYASPTCNPTRQPVQRHILANAIMFVAGVPNP